MSKDTTELDRLIAESEAAIQRLDELQKRSKGPLLQRIKTHFVKNKTHQLNVLLAGTVLAVALGRLSLKQDYQADREAWEAARQRLEGEKAEAQAQARQLLSHTEALVASLEEAAEKRRPKELPQLVRQQLADWRQRVGGFAAAGGGGGEGSAGSSGSDGGSGGGGSKIMI